MLIHTRRMEVRVVIQVRVVTPQSQCEVKCDDKTEAHSDEYDESVPRSIVDDFHSEALIRYCEAIA